MDTDKPSPTCQLPLVELVALQSFMSTEVASVLGSLPPP